MITSSDESDLVAYAILLETGFMIGFIISQIDGNIAVYANTDVKSKEQIIAQLNPLFPGINVQTRDIPPQIVKWAKIIAGIRQGRDQDTSKIPLDLRNYTHKQKLVIKAVCSEIPVGEFYSYGRIAELSGLPAAHRFVGTTMKKCRQPWIIPCHRVKSSKNIKQQKNPKNPRVKKIRERVPL